MELLFIISAFTILYVFSRSFRKIIKDVLSAGAQAAEALDNAATAAQARSTRRKEEELKRLEITQEELDKALKK